MDEQQGQPEAHIPADWSSLQPSAAYLGLLESMAEASDSLLCVVDAAGRTLFVNKKSSRWNDTLSNPELGKTLREQLPEEHANRLYQHLDEVLSSGSGQVYEDQYSGSSYRISLQPLVYPDRSEKLALLMATDISALINAQRDLEDLNRSLEKRVAEASAEIRDIYEHSPTGFQSIDANGMILMMNHTSLSWFGLRSEEIIGRKRLADLLDPASRTVFEDAFARLKTQGQVSELELALACSGGSCKPVLLSASVVYGTEGQFIRARVTLIDITERRKAEEQVRFQASVLERIAQAVIVTDLAGHIVYWNGFAEKMYGWSAAEALGQDIVDIAPSRMSQEQARQIMDRLSQGETWSGEFLVQRRDSTPFPALVTDTPLLGTDGQLVGIIGVSIDLSEKNKVEQEVRTARAFLHGVLDALSAHIAVVDARGHIVQVNASWSKFAAENGHILNYSWNGVNYLDVCDAAAGLSDSESAQVSRAIRAVLTGELAEAQLEYACHSPSERRWFNLRITPLRDTDQVYAVLAHENITPRKLAEEAARQGEQQYHDLLESLDSAVAAVDISGKILYINDAAASQMSQPPQALVGQRVADLLPAAAVANIQSMVVEALREKRKVVRERLGSSRGCERWYRTVVQPIHDETGQGLYALINSTDIDELKRAQQNLLELNETLENRVAERAAEAQDLYEHAPVGYFTLNGGNIFALINQTALDWLGYRREELVGLKSLQDLVTLSSLPHLDLSRPGDGQHCELEMARKDGRTLTVLLNWSAAQNEHGQAGQIRATMADISAWKQAESAARQLSQAVEASPVSVMITSVTGDIEYVNPAFCAITGYAREDALGKTPRLLKSDLHPPEFYNRLWSHLAAGETWRGEFRNRCKNGDLIWVYTSISPIFDEWGQITHYVGVQEDISEHKEYEDTLRESRDQLENANLALAKAARAKDEFLASMSHELRTPLTSILGLCEALKLGIYSELGYRQEKAVANIENSGRHLLALINDILDLSKIEAGKFDLQMDVCSLSDLCAASLQLVKGMAQQRYQKIDFSIDRPDIQVWADPRRLKQMLVNLLSNAIKFTPEGGALGLRVDSSKPEQSVRLVVWDKGVGIRNEDLTRLFQPFTQLENGGQQRTEGTGLGLSLVWRMAEMHGGRIEVESVFGEGSRFTLVLPWPREYWPAQTAPLEIAQATAAEPGLDGANMIHFLQSKGIKSMAYPAGTGALAQISRDKPHVVVLDLQLPDRPGLEVLAELRADPRTRRTPVIAAGPAGLRDAAFQAGAAGFISSPVLLADLQAELLRLHEQLPEISTVTLVSRMPNSAPLVLVVDDNAINTQIIRDVLENNKFRVITASSGRAVLEMAPSLLPDVVLMDIQMPEMDGFEAIRQLRGHSDARVAGMVIIALTALTMSGDRDRCLQAGADDFMSKPFEMRALIARIQELLTNKKPSGG